MMVSISVSQVSQWYDLVVFTASMEIYGAAVAEKLDRNRGILKRRYYRQVASYIMCIEYDVMYILVYDCAVVAVK